MIEDNMSFASMVLSVFILLNSYAQIPLFLALTKSFDQKRQKLIIIREMIFALIILFLFIIFGSKLLGVIGIKQPVLGIAGGLLLIIIALNMIFPKDSATKGLPHHEPFIVPLAIPGIAGPGSITALMVISKTQGILLASSALLIAWVPSTLLLLSSAVIKNYLGDKGLQAIERLGGMIIVLIGIQMFALGCIDLVKDFF